MSTKEPRIALYTAGTPNGQKASITLAELGLEYDLHAIDFSKNEQKDPSYLKINPNGRIPAIVDDGRRVFESGALQLYLCEKYDKERKISFEYGSDEYWEALCWLTWAQSGLGPMQGQANHFVRYAPEKIEYGIKRYVGETKRLYQVLEDRLGEQEKERGAEGLWIVGGRYTIVDLNCFCWVNWAEWAGVKVAESTFPRMKRWADKINERPAVQKGLNVPEKFVLKEKLANEQSADEYAKGFSGWIMEGQNNVQEKHG